MVLYLTEKERIMTPERYDIPVMIQAPWPLPTIVQWEPTKGEIIPYDSEPQAEEGEKE